MSNEELLDSFNYSEIIEEPKGEIMAEKKEIIKIDDKTKATIKKIGFGLCIVGGVLACIGGATLDEVNNGALLAFGIVDIVGAVIAFIFGK